MKNFNVTFMPKKKGISAIQYTVEAENSKRAEQNAVIDMHEEGFNRNDFKAKAQVRSAA